MQQIKLGGINENADISNINLAYKLEDGMKIYIPTIQEKEKNTSNNTNITDTQDLTTQYVTASSGLIDSSTKNSETNQTTKVNINTATQSQLETLPGIGPSTASKIINYRKEKGNFKKIEDVKNVSGIGDSKFEKIKELICVK